jgi:predicted permease
MYAKFIPIFAVESFVLFSFTGNYLNLEMFKIFYLLVQFLERSLWESALISRRKENKTKYHAKIDIFLIDSEQIKYLERQPASAPSKSWMGKMKI